MPKITFLRVEYQISLFHNYLDVLEESLKDNAEVVLESLYKKTLEDPTKDFEDQVMNWQYYTHHLPQLVHTFPYVLMRGFVVTWYSFFERELLNFCNDRKIKIEVGPHDNLRDWAEGIERARLLLKRVKAYEIDRDHWSEIITIRRIRNHIVHVGDHIAYLKERPQRNRTPYVMPDGSEIYLNDADLQRYLLTHEMLQWSDDELEISPSFSYGRYLLRLTSQFFHKLNQDLRIK